MHELSYLHLSPHTSHLLNTQLNTLPSPSLTLMTTEDKNKAVLLSSVLYQPAPTTYYWLLTTHYLVISPTSHLHENNNNVKRSVSDINRDKDR